MFDFRPLRITAKLATPFAVNDAWSPSIEALLEYCLLSQRGLICSNPTVAQVLSIQQLMAEIMPLSKHNFNRNDFVWAASSPHYILEREQTNRYRKRRDYFDRHLNWGSKTRKISTSDGPLKNYDLPLYLRSSHQIDWFVVGDRSKIRKCLHTIFHIGKKRSHGQGEVWKWEIDYFQQDWSLYKKNVLTRPIPIDFIGTEISHQPLGAVVQTWGWKSPGWMPENRALCYMPTLNVKQL